MKIIGVNQEIRNRYEREQEEYEKANMEKIECPVCGAILRYDPWQDVEEEYTRVNAYEDKTLYYYIECPHCGSEVITKDCR